MSWAELVKWAYTAPYDAELVLTGEEAKAAYESMFKYQNEDTGIPIEWPSIADVNEIKIHKRNPPRPHNLLGYCGGRNWSWA